MQYLVLTIRSETKREVYVRGHKNIVSEIFGLYYQAFF